MKISTRWLGRHVDLTGISPKEIAQALTIHTAEVEGLEPFLPHLGKIVVGLVQSREKHPDADKLGVCKQSTWIELLPCGMVHPNVLKAGGIDPEEWTGFAFGLGLSRLVMLRYGIDDVRHLLSGDLRFLEQY